MKNCFRTLLSRFDRSAKNPTSRQLRFEPMEERTLLAAVSFNEAFKTVDFELEAVYEGDAVFPVGGPVNYSEHFSSDLAETGTITFTGPLAGSGTSTGGGNGSGNENYRPDPSDNGNYTFSHTGSVDFVVIPDGLRRSNPQELSFSSTSPNVANGDGGHSPYDPNIPIFIDLPIDTTQHPFPFSDSWNFPVAGGSTSGTYSGTIADTNTTPIDARLLSAELTGEGTGVDFEYDVLGWLLTTDDPSQPVSDVRVFWSSSDDDHDVIGGPIESVPIHWNTEGGVASITDLGPHPDGATHLIVVVDDLELIPDTNDENNVIALELPSDPEPMDPPTAPGSVIVDANGPHAVNISWVDSMGEESYNIYQYDRTGAHYIGSLGADATSLAVNNLGGGTRYHFLVQAVNQFGSANSPWTVVTTPGVAPTSPAPLVLDATSPTSVDLSWTDSLDESGYNVYQYDRTGSHFIGRLAANTTGLTVSGLDSGSRYHFLVRATNSFGSASTPWTLVTTPGVAPTSPAPLMVDATSSTTVDLSWTDSANESGYNLYQYDRTGAHYIGSVGADVTSTTVSGLDAGGRYHFLVQATNGFGRASSGWQVVTTPNVVAFEFTAVVTDVFEEFVSLGDSVEVGDEVTGTFMYSLDLVDQDRPGEEVDPTFSTFFEVPTGPTQRMTLTNDDGDFEFESNGDSLDMGVDDFAPGDPDADYFFMIMDGDSAPVGLGDAGIVSVQMFIDFFDSTHAAFNTDRPPATLSLADFDDATFEVCAIDEVHLTNEVFLIRGNLTSVTAIDAVFDGMGR